MPAPVGWDHYKAGMQRLLDRHGIFHFTPEELARPQGGLPPEYLWPNAIPTLIRLQLIRIVTGRKLTLCSTASPRRGYRDPLANAAVGGASGSIHMTFNAFDTTVEGLTPAETVAEIEKLLPEKHLALMGIGVYPTFVHIDTRGLLGLLSPARWTA